MLVEGAKTKAKTATDGHIAAPFVVLTPGMRSRNRYLRDCLLKICSAKILQRSPFCGQLSSMTWLLQSRS